MFGQRSGGDCRTSISDWGRCSWRAVALAVAVAASGCAAMSGGVLREAREQFNDTAQITNAEQILRNIVRLRYGSSPYFLEINTVSTSATMSGGFGASGNTSPATPGLSPNIVLSPSINFSQTPSFVFQPLTGQKLARELLRPVDLRTIALLHTAGWNLRDILLVLVDSINGISNAPTATQFAPGSIPENRAFRHVADLFQRLQERGVIQLGVDAGGAAPAPAGDIVLSLQIDHAAASLADVQELIRLLSLDPATLTYRLAAAASGGGGKNIALKPRSVLAAMRYLSKAIEVPDADVRRGLVPVLRDSGGSLYAWSRLLNGIMAIPSSESRPADAYISVLHQGHWFYIADSDLASKQTFALLETAFALQAGDVPPITTVLTLPISR